MFDRIGKLLLALIAALMVVDPVMACCLAGPAEIVPADQALAVSKVVSEDREQQAQTNTKATVRPPCHGGSSTSQGPMMSPSVVETQAPVSSEAPCPDCGLSNCDDLISQEAIKPLTLLKLNLEQEDLTADTLSTVQPAIARLTALRCLPQRPPPRAASTPVSLRQRLLI